MSFALSLLSIEIVGMFFIFLAVRPSRQEYFCLEFVCLSFLAGMAFTSYQLFLYYVLGIDFNLLNILIVPGILLLIIFSRYASKPERLKEFLPAVGYRLKWDLTKRFLAAGILVQILWVLFLVIPTPVYSHDAVANYALKAKIFYFLGGVPEGFFNWSESTVAHPDYPLLLPFLMTWIYAFTGFNDLVVNLVMPVIYLSFLGLFYSQAKKIFSGAYALLLTFFIATVPQVADYATVIHTDLILTAVVTAAFLYFFLYIRNMSKVDLVLSSILIGSSLWVKNEAIVFAGALLAVFAAFVLRSGPADKRRLISGLFLFIIIAAVISAPWLATKALNHAANSDIDISRMTPDRLLQNVKDIPVLLNLFQQEVFGPKKWNILWMILLAAVIWKRKDVWRGENFYTTLFIILAASGYFAGYMATTGNNLYFYVNTTISRFMLHFSGLALFLTASLIYGDVREVPSFKEGS
ncbi:MAG: glycosyltransferase family 39 protein [Candidatus Omnitrophota bacterium]